MRDILPQIKAWRAAGQRVAVATVVKVWGSAPRPLGSKMAISEAGDMAGSVSGGCVEGAVFEEAQGVLASGEPKLVGYGVSDEQAWAVGLSCGGRIEVFIEVLADRDGAGNELYQQLADCLDRERLVARAMVLSGDEIGRQVLIHPGASLVFVGSLGEALDAQVSETVGELLVSFANRRLSAVDDTEVFVEIHTPRPRLVIVGAVHVAIHLATLARVLGMRCVVVDPRTAFATPERFAHADELITDWPDAALRALDLNENTFVALLSHDLKLDLPALEVALPSPARYIGALGSKKTHAKRVAALVERGVDPGQIERIHNPIGLDLGGRRAEEIALAVLAEIVAVSHGRR